MKQKVNKNAEKSNLPIKDFIPITYNYIISVSDVHKNTGKSSKLDKKKISVEEILRVTFFKDLNQLFLLVSDD